MPDLFFLALTKRKVGNKRVVTVKVEGKICLSSTKTDS